MWTSGSVAREADEAALAGLLRRLEGLHRSSGSEDLVDVILRLDGVDLPEVEVVGLHETEGGSSSLMASFAVRWVVLEVRKTFFRTPSRPMP